MYVFLTCIHNTHMGYMDEYTYIRTYSYDTILCYRYNRAQHENKATSNVRTPTVIAKGGQREDGYMRGKSK